MEKQNIAVRTLEEECSADALMMAFMLRGASPRTREQAKEQVT